MPYLNGQVISDEDLQGKLSNYRKQNSGAPDDDQSIINFWEGKTGEDWKNQGSQPAAGGGAATQRVENQWAQNAGQNDARNTELWNTYKAQVDKPMATANDPAIR